MIRGPQRIVYLPIRTLTQEEAQAERDRFIVAQRALRDVAEANRASALHQELLTAWTGKEHALRAFWNEIRRQMASSGIMRQTINALIPRPPE